MVKIIDPLACIFAIETQLACLFGFMCTMWELANLRLLFVLLFFFSLHSLVFFTKPLTVVKIFKIHLHLCLVPLDF